MEDTRHEYNTALHVSVCELVDPLIEDSRSRHEYNTVLHVSVSELVLWIL